MRKIKFRVWHKFTHLMATVDMLDFTLDAYRAHDDVFSGSGHFADIEIMQFTGLLDMHGKEVYEGDIVNPYGYPYDASKLVAFNHHEVVRYDEQGLLLPFHESTGYESETWIDDYAKYEIIGNIHENPELVKHRRGQ